MRNLIILLAAILMSASMMAKEEMKIDKDNCTITKNGKTFKLYGKVKIVDNFEDIKIKIVNNFEGIKK